MTFRVFSKKVGLYTNDVGWPSNQRSASDWFLDTSGRVVEAVFFDENEPTLVIHDGRNFAVEPFTGFCDSAGKKIYLGDIIKLECFNLNYEVIWKHDRFLRKIVGEPSITNDGIYYFPSQEEMSTGWAVTGNIHGVTFNDEI